tara:strand:- start:1560 stop:1904 length:345 start_codon:yes stop_codon:yes gene_type:complete
MATVNKNKKIRVSNNDMSRESRMFAHTAIDLNQNQSIKQYDFGDQIPGTSDRGVCIYIGQDCSLEVEMEQGTLGTSTTTHFRNLKEGQFLPILVKKIISCNPSPSDLGQLVALY